MRVIIIRGTLFRANRSIFFILCWSWWIIFSTSCISSIRRNWSSKSISNWWSAIRLTTIIFLTCIKLIILNSFEISLSYNMSNFSWSQYCVCKILFYKISIMSLKKLRKFFIYLLVFKNIYIFKKCLFFIYFRN